MEATLRQAYDEQGFCIARKAIDAELAAETVEHVHWLVKKNPGTRPEHLHHELMVHDPFMHRLVTDEPIGRYCGAIPRT